MFAKSLGSARLWVFIIEKKIYPNPSSSHWAVPWYEWNTLRLNRNEARLNRFLSPLFYNCIIYTHFLLFYKAMKSSFFFKSGLWLLCGHWIEKQFNSLNSVFVASMYVSYPSLRLTACWLIQDLPHQMSSLILQVFRWILSWYTGCLLNRYQAVSIWTLEQGMDLQSKKFVKLYHHNILFASCTNLYHLWMNNGIWDCKHCFTHSFYYFYYY